MVSHAKRPPLDSRHPVHVEITALAAIRSLRIGVIHRAIRKAIAASHKEAFRILEYSVMHSHVHLVVEADDARALSRGIQGFKIRAARAINQLFGRRGSVWGDRYFARALTSPREVRFALRYVLLNRRKHVPQATGLDPCSSGDTFTGWSIAVERSHSPPVTRPPRTWLASIGWRRHGLIDPADTPGRSERP
jgi:REP element-mobilizing transposase RayT